MSSSSSDEIASTSGSFMYLCLFALSAITLFRRELSPNHRFVLPQEDKGGNEQDQDNQGKQQQAQQHQLDWKEIESILEGTGLEFGVISLLTVWMRLLHMKHQQQQQQMQQQQQQRYKNEEGDGGDPVMILSNEEEAVTVQSGDDHWKVLPIDVQVHVMTFLHPRDILSFALVNQTSFEAILSESHNSCSSTNCTDSNCTSSNGNGSTSRALWKRLWFRDFAWIVTCWEPGKQALQRSQVTSLNDFENYSARFYFSFAYCYLPYVLASHNTPTSCLVGLGGHVYDMSSFLPAHPGSQETVLVHAGRCATEFFAGIRHSYTAQKLAQKLCVIVDCSRLPVPPVVLGLPFTTSNNNSSSSATNTTTTAATTTAKGGLHHKNHHHYAYGLRPTNSTKLVVSPYLCHEALIRMLPPSSTDFASSSLSSASPSASLLPPQGAQVVVTPGVQRAQPAIMSTTTTRTMSTTTTATLATHHHASSHSTAPAAVASTNSLISSYCCLSELRAQLRREEVAAKEVAMRRYSNLTPLRDCHVFYDPFDGQWKGWYTNYDFLNVFVDL